MRTRYPPIEPNKTGFIEVGIHRLYWEESGNKDGIPVIFLHGGPGSGTDSGHRSFFDPKIYRIILMDQRGAGKSTPHASLVDNTTWHLVEDLEVLRKFLKIDKWVVFGSSWGSTLALTYAETHPMRVLGIILSGIFLGRTKEIHWFNQSGASRIFPDIWEKYLAPIPEEERSDLVKAYHKRLSSEDENVRKIAAEAWSAWEGALIKLIFDPEMYKHFIADGLADARARVECHYFINRCFFSSDNWIIENIEKIKKIPTYIVQGRYDMVCPMESAWELHKAFPEAHFEIIKDAGHARSESGTTDALIRATDELAQNFDALVKKMS